MIPIWRQNNTPQRIQMSHKTKGEGKARLQLQYLMSKTSNVQWLNGSSWTKTPPKFDCISTDGFLPLWSVQSPAFFLLSHPLLATHSSAQISRFPSLSSSMVHPNSTASNSAEQEYNIRSRHQILPPHILITMIHSVCSVSPSCSHILAMQQECCWAAASMHAQICRKRS